MMKKLFLLLVVASICICGFSMTALANEVAEMPTPLLITLDEGPVTVHHVEKSVDGLLRIWYEKEVTAVILFDYATVKTPPAKYTYRNYHEEYDCYLEGDLPLVEAKIIEESNGTWIWKCTYKGIARGYGW